jgi:inward rectifier potassium channel
MFKFNRNRANRGIYDTHDLGFGSVVSEASRKRLLNRDGTFNVRRTGSSFFGSLNIYHLLLNMRWPRLFALIIALYLTLNLVFATAYFLCGPEALSLPAGEAFPRFARAYFFSVHTFSTIGYGNILPLTWAANVVVTAESLVGLMSFAVGAGILFARISRPTARVLFSKKAVVAPYADGSAFMLRITNERQSQMVELQVKLIFTRFEGEAGHRIRKYYFLDLERRSVAFFPLAWTIVHPITDSSPLFGVTREDLKQDTAEFLVLLNGFDETFSQTVHTRSSYVPDEIEWGARFVSMYNPIAADEDLSIDVRRLDDIEPATLPDAIPKSDRPHAHHSHSGGPL